MTVQQRPKRCEDEQRERQDHRRAADVVDPLAQRQPAHGGPRQQRDEHGQQRVDKGVALRQVRRRRPTMYENSLGI